jgi:hypothetical protein
MEENITAMFTQQNSRQWKTVGQNKKVGRQEARRDVPQPCPAEKSAFNGTGHTHQKRSGEEW